MPELAAPIASDSFPVPAWLKAAATLGVTSVIALGLTYFLAKDLRADVKAITAAQVATQKSVDAHAGDQRAEQSIDRALLRGICLGVNRANPDGLALCEVGR